LRNRCINEATVYDKPNICAAQGCRELVLPTADHVDPGRLRAEYYRFD
jgi:hypothetical protein